MAQQTIGIGSTANDGTGDPARTAGQKLNAMFTEIYGFPARAPGFNKATRCALIADSHLGFGYGTAATSVGASNFAVSGGVATLTFPGNHNVTVGSRILVLNLSDKTHANPLSYIFTPVLSTPASNTLTISATYNGQTLADGNYGSLGGQTWSIYNPYLQTDSSILGWMNRFNANPFDVVSLYAASFTTAAEHLAVFPKILAGPQFDVGIFMSGYNDICGAAGPFTPLSITQANPGVVTLGTAHGWRTGQRVAFESLGGMTGLNGTTATITVLSSTTFSIGVNTSGFGAYTSGGAVSNRTAAADEAYRTLYRIQQMVDQLAALGRLSIVFVPPTRSDSTNSYAQAANTGLLQYRTLLTLWAKTRKDVLLIDVAKDLIDGANVNGKTRTGMLVADNVHMSTQGNVTSAILRASDVARVNRAIDYVPISIIEDETFNAGQTPTAWTASTAYTVGQIVRNGYLIFRCVTAGTSAGSGGPTGQGSAITDGGATWAFVSAYKGNLLDNGLMRGTADASAAGHGSPTGTTGTLPTNWFLRPTGGANLGIVSAGQAARVAVAGSNSANWGYGWNIDATFTAADQTILHQSYVDGLLGSAVGLIPGRHHRFGVTITARSDWLTRVRGAEMFASLSAFSGMQFFAPTANGQGNNNTHLPLLNGQSIQLLSEPVLLPASAVLGSAGNSNLSVRITSGAAGAVAYQLSNAFLVLVDDPYA
jgi:hypothetical protein